MKITIITVCFNSEKYLQETIDSVDAQTFSNIEYIVIDGASTDSTVEIIKRNERCISRWISEADEGMYNAINKGLLIVTGDYILILNSDDTLAESDVISRVADFIKTHGLDYCYGDIIKVKNGFHKKVRLFNVNFRKLLLSTHGSFVPHPCFFISAELNRKLNGYDITYRYASDYDYILRALSRPGVKGRHLGVYVTRFRLHEHSITASGKLDQERRRVLTKHAYYDYPYVIRSLYYVTFWIYYKLINVGHRYRA